MFEITAVSYSQIYYCCQLYTTISTLWIFTSKPIKESVHITSFYKNSKYIGHEFDKTLFVTATSYLVSDKRKKDVLHKIVDTVLTVVLILWCCIIG